MAKKNNKKVVKFHRTSHFNIGVVVFLIIFVYMVYNIFQYFTAGQVAVYEVTQGTITQNHTYTGVILREEKVFQAENSGYINYYNRDAAKVSVNSYVYSVDETGDFYKEITSQNDGQLFAEKGSYDELEKTASNYVLDYSNEDFYKVYTFQYDMEAELMEAISANALSSLDHYQEGALGFHIHQAAEPGIVVYNTDGLEHVTTENFTKDIFDASAHQKENLISREQVTAGEPAYKMITSEIWNLVVPIEKELADDLAKESNIQVEFKKDNSTAWGASRILNQGDDWYLILTFQNSAIRFAADRYLDVKLLLSDTNGLKIPNTALTKKDFFLIPKDFLTKGGDDGNSGVTRQYQDDNGKIIMEFTEVAIAEETENRYYIAASALEKGDILIKSDSSEKFTLSETESLPGVFNINRGYAVFRKVEILFQNQEYTIVDTGTSYGISLYDHIALEASAIRENEIIR
ncbi:HlyD family efflux transporter periplasmic adaptor subunit [Lachnospiraceae bacterium KK002]